MSEDTQSTAEKILDGITEAISEATSRHETTETDKEEKPVSLGKAKLFGREKSVHSIIGGGSSADVMLWRDKKMSTGLFVGSTAIWVFSEWLEGHFLTLVCFCIVIGLVIQFAWSNASGLLNRPPPRLVLPDEYFSNFGSYVGAQINRFLGLLQDVACGKDLKNFVLVIAGLWVVAIIGSWLNFVTVVYIVYIAAHTLPAIYEKYDDQIDAFVYSIIEQGQHHYKNIDKSVISKIAKGGSKLRKTE